LVTVPGCVAGTESKLVAPLNAPDKLVSPTLPNEITFVILSAFEYVLTPFPNCVTVPEMLMMYVPAELYVNE
jgi:hypothetical protein